MMPEEGAIPPRLLQANVPEALEYELVDGLGHDFSLEKGVDVLWNYKKQGCEGPDDQGVDHGCTCHGASPLHILTSISD